MSRLGKENGSVVFGYNDIPGIDRRFFKPKNLLEDLHYSRAATKQKPSATSTSIVTDETKRTRFVRRVIGEVSVDYDENSHQFILTPVDGGIGETFHFKDLPKNIKQAIKHPPVI